MVNNIYANIAVDSISHFASTPHYYHELLFVFVLELDIQETSTLPRLADSYLVQLKSSEILALGYSLT